MWFCCLGMCVWVIVWMWCCCGELIVLCFCIFMLWFSWVNVWGCVGIWCCCWVLMVMSGCLELFCWVLLWFCCVWFCVCVVMWCCVGLVCWVYWVDSWCWILLMLCWVCWIFVCGWFEVVWFSGVMCSMWCVCLLVCFSYVYLSSCGFWWLVLCWSSDMGLCWLIVLGGGLWVVCGFRIVLFGCCGDDLECVFCCIMWSWVWYVGLSFFGNWMFRNMCVGCYFIVGWWIVWIFVCWWVCCRVWWWSRDWLLVGGYGWGGWGRVLGDGLVWFIFF